MSNSGRGLFRHVVVYLVFVRQWPQAVPSRRCLLGLCQTVTAGCSVTSLFAWSVSNSGSRLFPDVVVYLVCVKQWPQAVPSRRCLLGLCQTVAAGCSLTSLFAWSVSNSGRGLFRHVVVCLVCVRQWPQAVPLRRCLVDLCQTVAAGCTVTSLFAWFVSNSGRRLYRHVVVCLVCVKQWPQAVPSRRCLLGLCQTVAAGCTVTSLFAWSVSNCGRRLFRHVVVCLVCVKQWPQAVSSRRCLLGLCQTVAAGCTVTSLFAWSVSNSGRRLYRHVVVCLVCVKQ